MGIRFRVWRDILDSSLNILYLNVSWHFSLKCKQYFSKINLSTPLHGAQYEFYVFNVFNVFYVFYLSSYLAIYLSSYLAIYLTSYLSAYLSVNLDLSFVYIYPPFPFLIYLIDLFFVQSESRNICQIECPTECQNRCQNVG